MASVNYGEVPADAESALAGACPIVASFGGRDFGPAKTFPERLSIDSRSLMSANPIPCLPTQMNST